MAQSIAITDSPFNWKGTDSNGKKVKGQSMAASEAAVRAELRRRGVVASKVRKQSTLFQNRGTVTSADISIFSRQLATMLTAGIPLVQSFDIIGKGHDNPAMQKLVMAVKADVEGGTNLADALARHPEVAFEKDFLRWMLSDGAGAILLQPQPRSDGISLRLDWIFERSYANEMSACMYAGAEKQLDGRLRGWNEFPPQEWLDQSIFSVKQDVKQLNEYVILYTVEKPLLELIKRRNLSADDYDYFLPHFSSMYFRDKVYEKMLDVAFDLPQNRWFTNLTTKGNTGSASIYIMLEELFRSGRLRDGQKLLCYIPESGRFSTAFMQLTVVDPDAQQ